ncbi:MAG: hypothetical protein WAU45_04515 [Blastocatellia bacterium]
MRFTRVILLIAIVVAAVVIKSDGQQARPVAEQLKLAGVMPRGAMLYLQAADLSALMKRWIASPVRAQFYKSASFTAFSKSRIYLKLQDRRKDFETALGFGLDENRLGELAGGASAVAIYDIGNLEIVLVTEVPRARAVTTTLFKRAPQFSERQAGGGVYYVRDVTTDGGRLNQQFCFAHVDGKLIITTTEGLMIRAIASATSAGADSLIADVLATAEQARGFAAHEVTMWLDQARLNRNRHFNSYWIHNNVADASAAGLSNIESGLIDLRFTREGMTEQRWFKMGAVGQAEGTEVLSGEQSSGLLRFAPADAQLIEVSPGASGGKDLNAAVSQALFGKLPEQSWSAPEAPDRTRASRNSTRGERYRNLDARFDVDVDDEQAPGRRTGGATRKEDGVSRAASASGFSSSISAILSPVSGAGYCQLVSSRSEGGKPFVGFERAVVIEMKGTQLDRARLERAIVDELRARFIVGVAPALEWQDADSVRYVAQAITGQGAAYAVSGNYLVLASSREFARDIVEAGSRPPSQAARIDGAVAFYGVVRVADAKPVFDKLMSKLDGRGQTNSGSQDSDDQDDDEVKFFSENLSSLIAASAVREFQVKREREGAMLLEQVVYRTQE